ncbi:MAG: CBS domain-containing protein [Actinomycetota bacterium]|nr:CBS domain-containing protein [Actinomycetota bacterium]
MSPRTLSESIVRDAPLLGAEEPTGEAVQRIVSSGLPALPVVDSADRLCGIFGEREFIAAIFPGYLGELHYAHFVTRAIDDQLDRRAECRAAPVGRFMNTEHIDVGPDHSDAELAETFLHHRVLIVPITEHGRVRAVITRNDFFRALVERFSGGPER